LDSVLDPTLMNGASGEPECAIEDVDADDPQTG
jgi:hypothetical protein